MFRKIRDNGWFVLSVFAVFLFIYIFFAVAHPVVPYDGDDWRYLGQFRRPLPEAAQWNPSRVLPEVITPLAGYFAAYVVKPFVRDYLNSIVVTVALSMAFFTSFFYITLYRMLNAFSKSRVVSIFSALIIICAYFALLKTIPNSQYMLYSYNLNTIYAYTVPNLLCSAMVCILMRHYGGGEGMSLDSLGLKGAAVLLVALYFAVFSIMFASIMIAVYCFFEILLGIIKKENPSKNFFLIAVFAAFLVYCVFELTGERANSESGGTTNLSFFSLEFLSQLQTAWWNFQGLLYQLNKPVVAVSLFIIFFALIFYANNRRKEKDNGIVKSFFICFLSFVCLVPGLIFVGGKAGPGYCSLTHTMYSVFFYFFLMTATALVYILSKFRKAALALPFMLVILFVETTNSSAPYIDQSNYAENYFGRTITTAQKKAFVASWIETVSEADGAGLGSVSIRIPESSSPQWPQSLDYFGEVFSKTLYAHSVISREIPIILEPDMALTMTLVEAPRQEESLADPEQPVDFEQQEQ
jgi:hypothetical protein